MSKGAVMILVVVGFILMVVVNMTLWTSLNVFNPSHGGHHLIAQLSTFTLLLVSVTEW